MGTNKKGRPKAAQRIRNRNSTIPGSCKAAIVRLALRGWLPVKVAEWMIRVGGLRHE